MRWTVTSVFRLMYLLFHELKYKWSKLFHIDSLLRLFIYILLQGLHKVEQRFWSKVGTINIYI